jgi:uncharacterized damage-inducible protein DinB
MNRKDELLDTLKRSFDGGAWHGPSLKEALADVSAEEAYWRPATHVHSIWEITLHVAGWASEVAARLGGRQPQEPDGGDWPAVRVRDNDAWEDALQNVFNARDHLLSAVREQSETDLDEVIGSLDAPLGTDFSKYGTALGVAQHNTYHAGQIAVLKKLAREA